jgi:hypothetical protein
MKRAIIYILISMNICFIYADNNEAVLLHSIIDSRNTKRFIEIYSNSKEIIESDNEDLLGYSIYKKNYEISEYLINKGTNINVESKYSKTHDYIVFDISLDHNDELLLLLLKHNLIKNIISKSGCQLINCILYNNNIKTLGAYIDYGFSVNVSDTNDGTTPLELAIENDSLKAILLINSGAYIKNVFNNKRNRLIDYYCELAKVEDDKWNKEYLYIADIFYKKGLDPRKSFAIHTAVYYESFHFFEWLIKHDVDKNMKDEDGNIPIQRVCGPIDMQLYYIEKYPENYNKINEI